MFFPHAVDDAEHHHPLVVAHGRGAEDLLLDFVLLLELGKDGVAQLVAAPMLRHDSRRSDIQRSEL